MDSKVVNKYIREIIRPELKKLGFKKFTTRNSWRYRDEVIDIINFQSFNSYNADVMGVTTYSFSVNLGSYHIDIPSQHKIKEKDGLLLPEEYESPFRGGLSRTIQQNEIDRVDIWFVNQKGSNVEECVVDAKNQILNIGMDWFDKLSSKEELRNILKYEKEDMQKLWGFGNDPSPNRSYLLGYVELILGNESEAKKIFSSVVESGSYKDLFETVDEAVSLAL